MERRKDNLFSSETAGCLTCEEGMMKKEQLKTFSLSCNYFVASGARGSNGRDVMKEVSSNLSERLDFQQLRKNEKLATLKYFQWKKV